MPIDWCRSLRESCNRGPGGTTTTSFAKPTLEYRRVNKGKLHRVVGHPQVATHRQLRAGTEAWGLLDDQIMDSC
jgi:hypothetical protein